MIKLHLTSETGYAGEAFARKYPEVVSLDAWRNPILQLSTLDRWEEMLESIEKDGLKIQKGTYGQEAWLETVTRLQAQGAKSPWEVLTNEEFGERFPHLREETQNNPRIDIAIVGGVGWVRTGDRWVCTNEKDPLKREDTVLDFGPL